MEILQINRILTKYFIDDIATIINLYTCDSIITSITDMSLCENMLNICNQHLVKLQRIYYTEQLKLHLNGYNKYHELKQIISNLQITRFIVNEIFQSDRDDTYDITICNDVVLSKCNMNHFPNVDMYYSYKGDIIQLEDPNIYACLCHKKCNILYDTIGFLDVRRHEFYYFILSIMAYFDKKRKFMKNGYFLYK